VAKIVAKVAAKFFVTVDLYKKLLMFRRSWCSICGQ